MGLNNPINEQQVMENVPVFVVMDYHSKSVQVCEVDLEGTILVNRKCGSSVLEVGVAIGPGRTVQRVAIESCCKAADFADGFTYPHPCCRYRSYKYTWS